MQYIGLLIAAVLVCVDRLTKWLVVSNMELQQSIHIIQFGDTEVLNISYYTNNGAAFSRFEGQTEMLITVTSLVLIVLIGLLLFKKVKRTPYIMAFSLIIGGGVGNLIDRIANDGKVVDFIDFRLINFAIFNFADICAVCGAILLLLTVVADEIRERRVKRAAAKAGAEAAEGNNALTEAAADTEQNVGSVTDENTETADGTAGSNGEN